MVASFSLEKAIPVSCVPAPARLHCEEALHIFLVFVDYSIADFVVVVVAFLGFN